MKEDSELKEGKEEALPFRACACCSAGPAKPGGGPCGMHNHSQPPTFAAVLIIPCWQRPVTTTHVLVLQRR